MSSRVLLKSFSDLPRGCQELTIDHLEGADLRAMKAVCRDMIPLVLYSKEKRRHSDQLAFPSFSYNKTPGKEIKDLYTADLENTRRIVTQLKAEGRLAEINSVYYDHFSPLQAAVYQGLEKVKILVEEGEAKDCLLRVDQQPEHCLSSLATAAAEGKVDVVRYLLSQGANPSNPLSDNRGSEVYLIAELVDRYCSRDLIEKEISEGNPTICEKQIQCLDLILSNGGDLRRIRTQRSATGECPVAMACSRGRRDIMELLLEFGFRWADLEDKDSLYRLLINAVVEGHAEIVRWFVETYQMDVNIHGHGGITLLHMAKASRKEDVVEYLLSCGANPEALTEEGQDYQTYARAHISLRAVNALVHFCATMAGWNEFKSLSECLSCLEDVDVHRVIDEKGNTLLHKAAQWPAHELCYETIIPALIGKGANLAAKNALGETSYDVGMKAIKERYSRSRGQKLQEMQDRVEKLKC